MIAWPNETDERRAGFNLDVPPNGYAWWYVDAISDDGREGLTIIAFIGSVFSPYYAFARRGAAADPLNHCALNVALYHADHKRWTMTERSIANISRDSRHFQVGPSSLHWDGNCLEVRFDEWSVPIPKAVRGKIRVYPDQLFHYIAPLDDHARHHWGPIAPSARVEVELDAPELSWKGHAYLDSNEGDEPVSEAFHEWDWSRALLSDGSTAVIYDVQQKSGDDHLLGLRFSPRCHHTLEGN